MKNLNSINNHQTKNTLDRIFYNAMRLFLEKGYHATAIDDITRAAGITKGAFYWHFKSKEGLLRMIIEKFEKQFLDGLVQSVKAVEGGILDKFEKMIRYNAAFAYYNRELSVSFTTLAGELVGAHHAIEPEIKRIYAKYQLFLSGLINQGQREKVFKGDLNAAILALVIIAFHDGILLRWFMNKDEIDGRAYVETFKKIILRGMLV